MRKRVFYTEAAFATGLLLLALGTALTAFGGFGISMVVGPAYILHLKVSEILPFFTFGMAEYALQAVVLLVLMLVMRKVRLAWLMSFVTAVVYGFALDGAVALTGLLPGDSMVVRIGMYVFGDLMCTAAISLLFRSYLPPEVYELFVKEVAERYKKPISLVKTLYDCASMVLAVIMSLIFFGKLTGVGIGSVVCALLNGFLIREFTKLFDQFFVFEDKFALPKKGA